MTHQTLLALRAFRRDCRQTSFIFYMMNYETTTIHLPAVTCHRRLSRFSHQWLYVRSNIPCIMASRAWQTPCAQRPPYWLALYLCRSQTFGESSSSCLAAFGAAPDVVAGGADASPAALGLSRFLPIECNCSRKSAISTSTWWSSFDSSQCSGRHILSSHATRATASINSTSAAKPPHPASLGEIPSQTMSTPGWSANAMTTAAMTVLVPLPIPRCAMTDDACPSLVSALPMSGSIVVTDSRVSASRRAETLELGRAQC